MTNHHNSCWCERTYGPHAWRTDLGCSTFEPVQPHEPCGLPDGHGGACRP